MATRFAGQARWDLSRPRRRRPLGEDRLGRQMVDASGGPTTARSAGCRVQDFEVHDRRGDLVAAGPRNAVPGSHGEHFGEMARRVSDGRRERQADDIALGGRGIQRPETSDQRRSGGGDEDEEWVGGDPASGIRAGGGSRILYLEGRGGVYPLARGTDERASLPRWPDGPCDDPSPGPPTEFHPGARRTCEWAQVAGLDRHRSGDHRVRPSGRRRSH
jgi:hypothetical protein